MTADIRLEGVTHHYVRPGTRQIHPSVAEITLHIDSGEFFCLLGPSGCGKSTLLNVVAGFERPSAGTVTVGGEQVRGPGADRGVVFQSQSALFPWLTVAENVAYGPRAREGRGRRDDRVASALDLVELSGSARKFPRELSGGMQQRCQIARVIANDPMIMLMDEPFGALDAQTRQRLQHQFVDIWQRARKTVLFVTHDVSEAVLLADRIGVLSSGPSAVLQEVVPVDMPRPRDSSSVEFAALVRSLSLSLRAPAQAAS